MLVKKVKFLFHLHKLVVSSYNKNTFMRHGYTIEIFFGLLKRSLNTLLNIYITDYRQDFASSS